MILYTFYLSAGDGLQEHLYLQGCIISVLSCADAAQEMAAYFYWNTVTFRVTLIFCENINDCVKAVRTPDSQKKRKKGG